MDAFSYIKSNVNIKLAPSKVHGVGVFAIRDIKQGEKLFVPWESKSGKYQLTQEEIDSLDIGVKQHLYDMFEFSKSSDGWKFNVYLEESCYWIFKSPTHWINSCSWDSLPNVDLSLNVATMFISSGSELLTKYGKYQKHENLSII